jgi:hypothetical protein
MNTQDRATKKVFFRSQGFLRLIPMPLTAVAMAFAEVDLALLWGCERVAKGLPSALEEPLYWVPVGVGGGKR